MSRLAAGLQADTFEGSAWIGIVVFWRGGAPAGSFRFPYFELALNLLFEPVRCASGRPGILFYAIGRNPSPRLLFSEGCLGLPYEFSHMRARISYGEIMNWGTSLAPKARSYRYRASENLGKPALAHLNARCLTLSTVSLPEE